MPPDDPPGDDGASFTNPIFDSWSKALSTVSAPPATSWVTYSKSLTSQNLTCFICEMQRIIPVED